MKFFVAVLLVCVLVAGINAHNLGKEVWKFELGSKVGAPLRGVSYWPGDNQNPPLILAGTSDGKLLALNAKTGNLFQRFGKDGAVDLRVGVTEKFPDATYHM